MGWSTLQSTALAILLATSFSFSSPAASVPDGIEVEWTSPHFHIACDFAVPPSLQVEIGQLLESAFQLCQELPAGDQQPEWTSRYRTYLLQSDRAFRKLTGASPDRTAGIYLPELDAVVISGRYFLRRSPGFPWRRVPATSFRELEPFAAHVLAHEATHQVLGALCDRLPPWLSEGLAEYVSALCHPSARTESPADAIRAFVHRETKGQPEIALAELETVIATDHPAWRRLARSAEDPSATYLAAFTLTSYLLRHERQTLVHYVRTLQAEGLLAANQQLLHRPAPSLPDAVAACFTRLGIQITF